MAMQRRHFDVVTHVHACAECPDAVLRHGRPACNQLQGDSAAVRAQNERGITVSCPQWPWSKT